MRALFLTAPLDRSQGSVKLTESSMAQELLSWASYRNVSAPSGVLGPQPEPVPSCLFLCLWAASEPTPPASTPPQQGPVTSSGGPVEGHNHALRSKPHWSRGNA